METRTLQVNPEDTGTRLDAWLAGQLPDVTRSAAARLCEEGRVTAAGKPLAKNYRLSGGEAVSVTLPDPEPVDVAPQNIPLDVVYEDSDVIVVNKPKGLVVHPAPGHPDGTLVNALLHHCGDSLSGIGRGAAARHRPPDRPGHLRPHHRGEKRCCPPEALRPASGPHPGPDLPLHRDRESPEGQRHGGRPHRPPPGGPEEDGGGGGRKSPCRVSRASAFMRWGCGFSTPGPGSWWSCGATCRRRSRPSCGSWRTEDRTTPGRSQRSGAFAPGSRVSGGSWSGVRGIHRGQDWSSRRSFMRGWAQWPRLKGRKHPLGAFRACRPSRQM